MESIQNDFAALPVTNDGKIEAPSMNQDRRYSNDSENVSIL